MRVSNFMEFTENHRFFASRDFSLCALDRKSFACLYQPMIGAVSAGLYHYLYHMLAEDATGYSSIESQRRLFLGLGFELNAAGRKTAVEAASRLEAVGLLQVFRNHNPVTDETIYEYILMRPLKAEEFFSNVHLTLLLRDKIGKSAVLELRETFSPEPPAELAKFVNREEATTPFYELFRIGSSVVDPELEAGWAESAPTRERSASVKVQERILHGEIMLRFPRGSANRVYVERLNRSPELMSQLNYLAFKYDLETPEICRLLDEDGMFHPDGTLVWDELQSRANQMYRQGRKRDEERERFVSRGEGRTKEEASIAAAAASTIQLEVPERFLADVTQAAYNEMIRQEPYTKVLERYFPGAVPSGFIDIFEKIDINYKLPEPVINVLIHYVLGMSSNQRLTKSFIDSIASNMLAKGIDTIDKAIQYVKEQEKLNAALERKRSGDAPAARGTAGTSTGRGGAKRKPSMPVVKDEGPVREVSQEEREKMLELARKLKEER